LITWGCGERNCYFINEMSRPSLPAGKKATETAESLCVICAQQAVKTMESEILKLVVVLTVASVRQ